jgi:hypothetical protein
MSGLPESGRAADIHRLSLKSRLPVIAAIRLTAVMEYWIGLPHQSALMLAARITLPHFSVSSAISLPKSAGEPGNVHAPISASRALSSASASPTLISRFNLSTMSAGVFWGAHTPLRKNPDQVAFAVNPRRWVVERLARCLD